MILRRIILLFFILSISATAKDVTYRLTGVEPLTFTIPDDWSSGWGIMPFLVDAPDIPPDFLVFSEKPKPLPEETTQRIMKPDPVLRIDARKRIYPLAQMKPQMTQTDKVARKIILPKPLYSSAEQTLIGYFNTRPSRHPGNIRLDAFWNLGGRAWSANIEYPPNQTNWVSTCVAIIESVRLADPETAPPTPRHPIIDGVEQELPEGAMEEWRSHHE